jgi:glycosyltransferase involved in cell wall biosynthesis
LDKYIFLIPVYNDWSSLNKLLENINNSIDAKFVNNEILIINDGSTENPAVKINQFSNLRKLTIINLHKNLGSQKDIAIGLKYLLSLKEKSIITIMDSDGEDDPEKINEMIEYALKNRDHVITSNRTNRKENPIFKTLYLIHKFITFVLSGYWISFGNFSSFDSLNLRKILKNNNSWLAYSSAVIDNAKIKRLYAKRLQRYFGKSKVKFLSLITHSLRVISVMMERVLVISFVYSLFLLSLYIFFNKLGFLIVIIALLIFNFALIVVKTILNTIQLDNWKSFIQNIEIIN